MCSHILPISPDFLGRETWLEESINYPGTKKENSILFVKISVQTLDYLLELKIQSLLVYLRNISIIYS